VIELFSQTINFQFIIFNFQMKDKEILSVSNSVLLGSIVIAAAIIFNPNLKVQTNAQAAQAQAGAPQAGKIVKIDERKEAPRQGSGKVVIEEFSDFQCPFCQSFYNGAYKDIKAKYIDTGKATIIFRHNPLSFHVNAEKSAEAAECANRQGKFWQYHDTLFTKGKSDGAGLDLASLKSYAGQLGLDTSAFNKCLDGGEAAAAVKADLDAGQKAGVTGTPTIVVNGELVVGAQPFANFQTIIDKALK
jgi:protein-disulfide isomerase